MKITRQISPRTIAVKSEKYEILDDGQHIGEATFLQKTGDDFTFKIQLYGNKKAEDYEYMFDVDLNSLQLLGLRAKRNK